MATGCNDDDSSSCCCSSDNNVISYLILGDGDFSFSFDLARRILLESSSCSSVSSSSSSPSQSFHLTATGIDTLQEMEYKYKDSVFLLKKLISLNDKNASNNNNNNTDHHHHHRLTVSIQHGVNAILPLQQPDEQEESSSTDNDNDVSPLVKGHNEKDTTTATTSSCHNHFRRGPEPADIVIFNHPHLGFEDANLHACFLAHLLESVNRYWLKKEKKRSSNNRHHHYSGMGIFYLTLALGQWERWKGNEAIARLGLFIINRLLFQAPLLPVVCGPTAQQENDTAATAMAAVVVDNDNKPYFQLRRHQTGKSFANRRKQNTSETFALGRLSEKDSLLQRNSSTAGRPFWYKSSSSSVQSVDIETKPTITTTTTFSCPFCDRTFSEQRSIKNHIRSKHVNDELKNRNSSSGSSSMINMNGVQHHNKDQQQQEWECPYCSNNTNTTAATNNNHVSKRPRRFFCNEQALNDHITAKHHALHSHIPPDYKMTTSVAAAAAAAIEKVSEQQSKSSPLATETVPQQLVAGRCDICLQVFENAHLEARHHIDRFVPPPAMVTTLVSSRLDTALKQFACNFCAKTFREKRARLQHENFCASRSTATTGPTIT